MNWAISRGRHLKPDLIDKRVDEMQIVAEPAVIDQSDVDNVPMAAVEAQGTLRAKLGNPYGPVEYIHGALDEVALCSRAHPNLLLSPSVVGLLADLDFLAHFQNRLALANQDIGLPELGHNLRS